MVLNRKQILKRQSMVQPFLDVQNNLIDGVTVPSFGLGFFGYDVRLGSKIILHSKHLGDVEFNELKHSIILDVGEWCLGHTMETFDMPKNVMAIVQGKSTYARQGILVNGCPIEPGWKGQYTVAIHNLGTKPVSLYIGGGIAQVIFFKGKTPDVVYDGKYQESKGVTPNK